MRPIHRRSFITGLISLVAAPPIVRVGSLMPVKVMIEPYGRGPLMAGLADWAEYRTHLLWDVGSLVQPTWRLLNEGVATSACSADPARQQ